MRAHQQTHVLEAQVAHRERPFQLGERARLVHAGVEQHDPVAGRDRPGVAVRNTGPGERQAQAEDPGKHPFAPSKLAFARRGARRAGAVGGAPDLRSVGSAMRRRLDYAPGARGGKGDGYGRGEERQRGGHESAGRGRQRARGLHARATDLQEHRRDRRAALLRGDRRARPRRGGGDVGGGRPRERARPSRCGRARGLARVHRRACSTRSPTCASRSSRRPPRTIAARCSGGYTGTFAGPGHLGGVAPTGDPDRRWKAST